MKIKDWLELSSISGFLEGMATTLDMTEEVDLKKLRDGIRESSVKIKSIQEAIRDDVEEFKRATIKKNQISKSLVNKKGESGQ